MREVPATKILAVDPIILSVYTTWMKGIDRNFVQAYVLSSTTLKTQVMIFIYSIGCMISIYNYQLWKCDSIMVCGACRVSLGVAVPHRSADCLMWILNSIVIVGSQALWSLPYLSITWKGH